MPPEAIAPEHRTLSGPVPPIRLRPSSELAEFERSVHDSLMPSFFPRRLDPDRWARTPQHREAASLAMDLIDSHSMPVGIVARLVSRGNDEEHGGLACDLLRVAAHLWRGENEQHTQRWEDALRKATAGLHGEDVTGAPLIATQADLEAWSAIAECVLLNRPDLVLEGRLDTGDGIVRFSRLRNRRLAQLIMERPADRDRIVAYVKERSISPHHTTDVDALRALLDEVPAALGEGWL